jgi:thiamine-phosphate diphosphorylase
MLMECAVTCAGADGVHVGQGDISVAMARKLLGPNRILGVSCKTTAQAARAVADGADYIGAGAGASYRVKGTVLISGLRHRTCTDWTVWKR